jgi:hypothetical protein
MFKLSRKLHSLKRKPVGTRYSICMILCFHHNVNEISLFWGVTQRGLVASYLRFGTTCPSHLERSLMGRICYPKTSVTNNQSILRNIKEREDIRYSIVMEAEFKIAQQVSKFCARITSADDTSLGVY